MKLAIKLILATLCALFIISCTKPYPSYTAPNEDSNRMVQPENPDPTPARIKGVPNPTSEL